MTLNPYTGYSRRGVPWALLGARAAGTVARNAWQWYNQPPAAPMYGPPIPPPRRRRQAPVYAPQPGPSQAAPRGRGRRRRPRGTGAPSRPLATTKEGSNLVVRDTEIISLGAKNTLFTMQFKPSETTLPRLDKEGGAFNRYRIQYVNIAYISTSSAATAGSVSYGVLQGPTNANIATLNAIVKLRPMESHAVWKNSSLSLGSDIMSAKYLSTAATGEDAVAFTVYAWNTADSPGYLQFSYRVEFAFPKP
ncbi:hypothetical protein 2 [Sanxia tombus-like virus 6]|uniref:hypothetical protein 2 n=1 Tax=Sanxia tombus-like virus 6 TaxID=1923390 RepID=UPI0009097106|nr:hypothetical protein 2 [Sanxia tombus-like virus 6]APG76429.1 hypothetical protein 2 [Sanxia tombus-like virus 6]